MICDNAPMSASWSMPFVQARYSPMTGRTAFFIIARYRQPSGPPDRSRILAYSLERWCRMDFVWISYRQPTHAGLSGNTQGKPPPVMAHRHPSCLETALPDAISWTMTATSIPDDTISDTVSLALASEVSHILTMPSIPEGRIPTSLIRLVCSWMVSPVYSLPAYTSRSRWGMKPKTPRSNISLAMNSGLYPENAASRR